jgi:8-oxo-dGTP diphosphatase
VQKTAKVELRNAFELGWKWPDNDEHGESVTIRVRASHAPHRRFSLPVAAMPLKPNYCSQCGQPVATRSIEGRVRAVCPACATIFYENPLPVAASIVMNARRELLLVKRRHPPLKGTWCLPMGFAETGETIDQAALRELKEEAGIDARVLRLVDADSSYSDHYGDLLIVTFEMQKAGGQEQPGDDAAEVHYFPLGRHPPLAFSSNEKAVRVCAAMHEEGWEIQDSFVTLQGAADKAMLSDALVELIQSRADEVARLWLADVRSNPTTPSYQRAAPEQLLARAASALSQFGRWLSGTEAAHEVLSSLMLLKKHVWTFARSQGVWERPIDVYRVLELDRRIAAFFDQAMYHAARAFDAPASS